MAAVLLTGAGFSFNWGGRLAKEVNTAIALRVQEDAHLADLLHRNPNFEEALTELQNACAISVRPRTAEQLRRLETAIVEVFADMNRYLASATFSFRNETGWTMPEFLALFDAIFTLNQDLLLETQYHHPHRVDLSLVGNRRWAGGVLPGVEEIHNPVGGLYDPLAAQRRPVASPRATQIEPRFQPYFKLHGSMNWQDPRGGRLLVMGGNKPTTIQRHPILMWYAEKFLEALSKPNARLMVIGYGFGDDHINRLIYEGWEKGGKTLSMFIVQPDGREILRKINPTNRPGNIYVRGPLECITAVYDFELVGCAPRSMEAIRENMIFWSDTQAAPEGPACSWKVLPRPLVGLGLPTAPRAGHRRTCPDGDFHGKTEHRRNRGGKRSCAQERDTATVRRFRPVHGTPTEPKASTQSCRNLGNVV